MMEMIYWCVQVDNEAMVGHTNSRHQFLRGFTCKLQATVKKQGSSRGPILSLTKAQVDT